MQPTAPQPTREEFIKSLFILEKEDNFISGKEALKRLAKGVKKGVEAIAMSYGASGTNAIVKNDLPPFYTVTNDGKNILDSLKLKDPYETMGLNVLKEIASKSDKESGDGRKTSILLAGAILEEGLKQKETPMEIKRSLEECLPIVIQNINDKKKEIGVEEVSKVATISSESEEIGSLFGEIYSQIGADGIVEIDNSSTPQTHYEITEGVKLKKCGFMWPYMANSDKGRSATYKNPKIMISKQKITWKLLDGILTQIRKSGEEGLVIFCDDIDQEAQANLAFLHHGVAPNGEKFVPFYNLTIKAPIVWKDYLFEDFSKITGATIIGDNNATSLKGFQLSYLGSCDKINTTKEETVVLGIKDISDHLKVLEDKGDDDSKRRMIWLKTKTAILYVGANSETELFYKRSKATDARNASYLALQDGVVAGGGVALAFASKNLPDTVGGDILVKALKAPYLQIKENAPKPKKSVVMMATKSIHEWGIDAKTGETVNMFDAGILDATIVTKNAITNALSVVSTILTINLAINHDPSQKM